MLVGLIADTHDRLPQIQRTVEKLNREDVELVLHAGDYVAPFAIPLFKELAARMIGVFGNNDGDHELLKRKFDEQERLQIRGNFAEIVLEDCKIALLHGSDENLLKVLVQSGSFDVVVHGHTHKAEVHRKEKVLTVNPGEICGYLTGRSTLALLDTGKHEVKIVNL